MRTTFEPGEIEGVIIRSLKTHSDERGWLMELFRSDEMDRAVLPVMGYISVTKPGVARGPHEHKEQTDLFCFVGPGEFEIRLWDNRLISASYQRFMSLNAGQAKPTAVVVPPGVIHGYRNIGEAEAMVINLPNQLYQGELRQADVDEIRYESDENSAFSMD